MAVGYLIPVGALAQIFSDQGVVGAGYKINTYVGGSVSTPVTTYTDSTLTVPNSNPIILGSNGRFQSVNVWVPSGTSVKLVLTDSNNNVITGGTIDNLSGINDPQSVVLTQQAVGAALYPQSAAEIAASVVPSSYAYFAAPWLWVRREGCALDGATDDSVAFSKCLAVASTTNTALLIDGPLYVNSNIVIPGNVQLVFVGNGKIKPGAAKYVQLGQTPQAGLWQIFDLVLGGTVLMPPLLRGMEVWAEWWGANGDGVTNLANDVAINAAFSAIFSGGSNLPAWTIGTSYVVGNLVSQGGANYQALGATTGNQPAAPISNISQAASAVTTVSTVSAANPFAVGQTVQFTGVLGMTQINNQTGTISAIGGSSGAWTFTVNINSSAYTAYASGGTAIDTTYWTPFQGAGGRVRLGAGAFYISATVNFQNYCTLTGMGNWTLLKAQNGWAGGANMINSTNGTSSMFDSRLENLRVDANAKAAITTVHVAQSWQNRCGWYNVTFTNFQGYGIVYQHGYGGAAVLEIDHCDFFPNDVAAACGAYFTNDASVGWLKLNVKNSTAASGGTQAVYGFWFDNRIIANVQGVDIETIGLGVNLTGAARLTGAGLSAGGTTPTYGSNCVVHCGSPWTGLINVSGVGLGGFTNMILDASRAYAVAAIEPYDGQLIWPPNSGRVFAGAVGTVSGTTLTLAWANGITMSRSSAGVYVCTLTTSFDGASAYDVICSSNDSTAPMCSVAANSATQFTVTTRNTSGTATDAGQFTVKVYHKP